MSDSKNILRDSYPYYLANRAVQANRDLEVTDKYTGEVVTRVALADEKALLYAIEKASEAAPALRKLSGYDRQLLLEKCAQAFSDRAEELAQSLCIEAGKPIRDSRGEVARLIHTFKIAAEEAVRSGGEVMSLDRTPTARGYLAMWKRVPLGPCSFITPFNFPLNLVAHKVAPALATGCPFVLKPAPNTPLGALIIGEVLAQMDLPEGTFSILPAHPDQAGPLITDDRLKLLSFTGSQIGWELKAKAGKKKVVLELGGNAACIVDETVRDIDDAVARMVVGAFYQSGQSCISVQRIYIHEKIYDTFKTKLVEATGKLKAGNPKEEDTFIGPIISEKDAIRIESWIQEALAQGGKLLWGGKREGALIGATLLEGVPEDSKINCQEVFGPVALLYPFSDFDEVLGRVNRSDYGLQAGLFTSDLFRMHKAWDTLEVGGVMVNEIPSWRVDHMPYGGVKNSGLGREGLRWAMEDMTELRLLVVRGV